MEKKEKKTISLGETLDLYEKEMTDSLIKTYDNATKNNKMFSAISGLAGATSAVIAAGNFVLGNNLEAISCTGTTVAMAAYCVGNALLAAHTQKKANRVKESFNEDLSLISAIKSKLSILKEKLEYNRITSLMYGIAGAGFTTTFVSNLFRPESSMIAGEGFVIFSAVLAGLTGVGTAYISKKSISEIKGTKLDITTTEAELKEAEAKNPEETQKFTDAMSEAVIAQQELSKGRTLK